MKLVRLIGCRRYSIQKRVFLEGEISSVNEEMGNHLLRQVDQDGYAMFSEVEPEVAEVEQAEAEAEEAAKPLPPQKPGKPVAGKAKASPPKRKVTRKKAVKRPEPAIEV